MILEYLRAGGTYSWVLLVAAVVHLSLVIIQIRQREKKDWTPLLWSGVVVIMALGVLCSVNAQTNISFCLSWAEQHTSCLLGMLGLCLLPAQFGVLLGAIASVGAGIASAMTRGFRLRAIAGPVVMLGLLAVLFGTTISTRAVFTFQIHLTDESLQQESAPGRADVTEELEP